MAGVQAEGNHPILPSTRTLVSVEALKAATRFVFGLAAINSITSSNDFMLLG
jgi:hypothetical protein